MSTKPIDHFWEACGAAAPLRLAVQREGDRHRSVRVFARPYLLVGRDARNDLALNDEQVGRRHAYLQLVAGRLYCVDLNSRTGIHWPTGQQQAGWLDAGESLRVGPYQIQLAEPNPEDDDPSETKTDLCVPAFNYDDPPPLPAVTLKLSRGRKEHGRWVMKGTVVQVGRAVECAVCLNDPSVSQFHCSLVRTPRGVWVIDLRGRGGICLNGTPVRCAHVKNGDELQIGRCLIRFRYDATARPNALPTALAALTMRPPNEQPLVPRLLTPPRADTLLLPAEVEGGAAANSLVLTLVHQVNQMHQQMFDQFQQATMMLVQMFSSLHGEQLDFIREELDRLRDLTGEMKSLHVELSRQAPAAAKSVTLAAARVEPAAAPANGGEPKGVSTNRLPGNGTAPENIHLWLTQRITAIQEEQQSSWQRIMQFVTGRRAESAAV